MHPKNCGLCLFCAYRRISDAIWQSAAVNPPKGLIFHSDWGVQYAAGAFRQRLKSYGIRQRMSLKGDPYDNAVDENFFNCLKCELIYRKQYSTRASAQPDVFAYLEAFYNTVRPHSALGWLSPAQFESSLLPSRAA